MVVQQRRPRGHRRLHVEHVRQGLVGDLDQIKRRFRDRRRDGGYRRHRMTVVQRLGASHHVPGQVAHAGGRLAALDQLVVQVGEVGAGDHRLHARQGQRSLGVDSDDAGVSEGAALDAPVKHARHDEVGAECGAAGHLVDAIGANRPRADRVEFRTRLRAVQDVAHAALRSCLSTAAASSTARITLS
jgi:hypothetical protein